MTVEALKQTTRKYCSRSIVTAVVIGILLILFDFRPMGRGVILGTIFSVINFVIIGETIPMRIGKTKKNSFLLAIGSIGVRYALLAVPLVISIKSVRFNIPATVCGLFMIQLMIMTDQVYTNVVTKFIKT